MKRRKFELWENPEDNELLGDPVLLVLLSFGLMVLGYIMVVLYLGYG